MGASRGKPLIGSEFRRGWGFSDKMTRPNMSFAGPLYCQKCGRPNAATAVKCLWCGLPIDKGAAPEKFDSTRIEIEYLSGMEGLDGPANVRLKIGETGIEAAIEPNPKVSKIAASSIVGAAVVDASYIVEGKKGWAPLKWWLMIGPFAFFVPGKKKPDEKKHDYLLSIKYKAGSETRTAVFRRDDRAGMPVIEGLARIVNNLAQRSARAK